MAADGAQKGSSDTHLAILHSESIGEGKVDFDQADEGDIHVSDVNVSLLNSQFLHYDDLVYLYFRKMFPMRT